jgi:hypothetical protein
MIRALFVPLVLAVLAFGLGGCATSRTVAGEPSPKEEGAAPTTQPAESASQGQVSETPAPPASTPPPAAARAAPPVQPNFIPSGKPQIIARVERVQFPAWVERGGVKAGIKAGWAIYTSDRLTTGAEGRVELGAAGGGRLNIGGDANVEITEAYEFTGGAVEPSLLTVHRGAVMWNSPTVRAGTPGTLLQLGDGISANVLGGEVYAQVNSEEALLVLVDGAVQVSGAKLNPGTMREASTSLRVPRTGRASPVTPVPGDRIARWLSGPVIVAGRPSLSANGSWDVSLNSGYSLKQLEEMACRIQRRGFPTEIYPVKEPGKLTWYRVVVRRFATKGDAVNFIGTARSLGSKEPWVLVPQS